MPLDQQAILTRAKAHLAAGTVESLRYAALECRLLMEELTYEKLRAYADQLPEAELERWQPREAVKMLLAIDPQADQSMKIHMAPEPLPDGAEPKLEDYERMEWVQLGEHHALSLKWLKYYHKVGQLLHAPKANESTVVPVEKQVKLLTEVMEELERAAGSTLRSLVSKGGIGFRCEGCGRQIVASIVNLEKGGVAICPNDDCQFEYRLAESDNGGESPNVTVIALDYTCGRCSTPMQIAKRLVKRGYEFSCSSCKARYQVLGSNWQIGIHNDDAGKPPPASS